MSAAHGDESHGPALCVFRSQAGVVSVCRCGVVTLTMQHLSLRLRPDAFRELTQLLAHAQTRLDRVSATAPAEPDAAPDPAQVRRRLH